MSHWDDLIDHETRMMGRPLPEEYVAMLRESPIGQMALTSDKLDRDWKASVAQLPPWIRWLFAGKDA